MYKNLVKGIEFFENIPKLKRLLVSLGPCLKLIKIEKDEIIFNEGEYANEMYFIKSGEIGLILPKYKNFCFHSIEKGRYFGEVNLF